MCKGRKKKMGNIENNGNKRKTRVISGMTTEYKKGLQNGGKWYKDKSKRVSKIEDHKEGWGCLEEGG